jgi:nucleoside-diphosphate-sugar epimerase
MGKILITGASGFIGSHLVDLLIQEKVPVKDIRLFILNGESLENIKHKNVEIVWGDILNIHDAKNAMKDIDIVYHLAAFTTGKDDSKFDVNWMGTRNLLKNKTQKLKKFILFSSIAVYGLPSFLGDNTNISEKSPMKLVGGYAKSKFKAELELLKEHKRSGLSYTIIRPTTVYGPRDKAGIYQLYKAIKSGLFIRIGNGKNKVDYVYVTDLVKGARLAEVKKRSGDYIIGSCHPISFNDLVDCVAESIDNSVPNFYLPRSIALLIGKIADMSTKTFRVRLPISYDRVKVMTANYYFDCTKAQRELGYKPRVKFIEGARRTAQWLIKRGLI